MTQIIINEGDLSTPVFCGSDDDINQALGMWSGVVSSITYMSSLQNEENKRNMIVGLVAFLNTKLEQPNAGIEPAVASYAPTPVPVPAVAVEPEAQEIMVQYESKKVVTENMNLRRMRELAGIPHPLNRV